MARVVRVRYEGGVLKPLEELDLNEGEELTVVIKGRSFYEVARELQVEAREDVDKLVSEVRGRGKKLYN
ncbi:MAG: antitoxin family protein [Desulfurococcales archaeon]|nr:antitoxin family protein [Desulfurococcales archaeon]